jgi:UDP-N-acetylglucosamine 2-epimerase (non-hydrolysing)
MKKTRIICVIGTRPEAIKMAPVILRLKQETWTDVTVVATAQHRELVDEVLSLFRIVPDVDLDLMRPGQALIELTTNCLTTLDATVEKHSPSMVIAQGDTTTVMTTAMVCFYRHIPFLHVEAGLRSFDLENPFPEEFNRIVASRLARLHFAPTESARQNLLKEGVAEKSIFVTGNTVIDALYMVTARKPALPVELDSSRRLILVTAHRRENFGEPMRDICNAVKSLVDEFPDVEVLWPVHPNPNVTSAVNGKLGGLPRIKLVAPLKYGEFVAAMKRAYLILSDSGGVQEEAPALGRPVLVMRRETERPEAIEAGVVRLVGTEFNAIV